MNKNILKSSIILFIALITLTGATGSYFTEQEIVHSNQFSAASYWPEAKPILINEVYYDIGVHTYPHGGGVKTEEEGKNEWIELYNPNSFAVNIKNYKIGNTSNEFTINPNVSIPANGFAILSHDNSTWNFWSEPSVVKINLGGSVTGGWLGNDGDYVYLKNTSATIIDNMSYGTNTTAFSPSCLDVSSGHSLERDPDGKDTNVASDFANRTTPTPGS